MRQLLITSLLLLSGLLQAQAQALTDRYTRQNRFDFINRKTFNNLLKQRL